MSALCVGYFSELCPYLELADSSIDVANVNVDMKCANKALEKELPNFIVEDVEVSETV